MLLVSDMKSIQHVEQQTTRLTAVYPGWTGWAATRQTLIHTHSDLMALINFLHFCISYGP